MLVVPSFMSLVHTNPQTHMKESKVKIVDGISGLYGLIYSFFLSWVLKGSSSLSASSIHLKELFFYARSLINNYLHLNLVAGRLNLLKLTFFLIFVSWMKSSTPHLSVSAGVFVHLFSISKKSPLAKQVVHGLENGAELLKLTVSHPRNLGWHLCHGVLKGSALICTLFFLVIFSFLCPVWSFPQVYLWVTYGFEAAHAPLLAKSSFDPISQGGQIHLAAFEWFYMTCHYDQVLCQTLHHYY